jgi:LPS-assembly lipoprotein
MTHSNLRHLALGLLILILATLQGCGFHLRGTADLPPSISPLYIEGLGRHDPLHEEFLMILTSSNVKLAESKNQAATILRVHNPSFNRRVLSVDGAGKVVEYELYQGLNFTLLDVDGKELVSSQRVSTQRSYENTETEGLGKQEEEVQLREDMAADLAGRIASRLQAQLR